MRFVILAASCAAALALSGCGGSSCARVCQKLASCNALTGTEAKCQTDCEQPASGHTCDNEDAIASCFEQASCDDITSESTRLQCPSCQ